ncbi:hypothetical protein [Enterococcus olivae]
MLETYSEKTLRKLKEIAGLISGETKVPNFKDAMKAKRALEGKLTGEGTVNMRYAKDVLIALEYAENKKYPFSQNTMLFDIENGQYHGFLAYH